MSLNSFPLKAVVFDLDGTLYVSPYNWKWMKETLGVKEGLILDYLYSLEEPERTEKFNLLDEMEESAIEKGKIAKGAIELLNFLKQKGIKTGVLTNNSRRLAKRVLSKIPFEFDAVITRDDGVYKPYPSAMETILKLLKVKPQEAIYVGDNLLDIKAAEHFPLKAIFIINDSPELKEKYREKVIFVSEIGEIIGVLNGKINVRGGK